VAGFAKVISFRYLYGNILHTFRHAICSYRVLGFKFTASKADRYVLRGDDTSPVGFLSKQLYLLTGLYKWFFKNLGFYFFYKKNENLKSKKSKFQVFKGSLEKP